jgi:hypothetical protein
MRLLLPQDVRRVHHPYWRDGAAAGFGRIGIQTLLDHHFNPRNFGRIEGDVPRCMQMLRQVVGSFTVRNSVGAPAMARLFYLADLPCNAIAAVA